MKPFAWFYNDISLTDKLEGLRKSVQHLKSRAEDIRGEVRNEEIQARKKQRSEVSLWLEEVDSMEEELQSIETEIIKGGHGGVKEKLDRMEEIVQNLVKRSEFPRGLLLDDFHPEGLELVTEKLEGSTPSDVQDKVWVCFERGEARVGLYGMGGVGKTSVAMHINNKILREKDTIFHHVFYVTVSRDTNVYKLQNNIAIAFGLHKLMYEDEPKRAAELRQELTKRQGSLLILDDVWEGISMAAVGVCVQGDGCKLLITTRRKDVSDKMKCVPVKINPLSDEESWELFKKQLGNYEELPGEVQQIARLVAKECDGLPLGIITMAGCMRGEHSTHMWRDALRTLQDPRSSQHDTDMEDNVFKILRFSYDRLKDEKLQKCFLYCALYPEDQKIEREELISHFIALEFLDGRTRQEKIDRGHTSLNVLENASLLECVSVMDEDGNWDGEENKDDNKCVKMHDLVRDMAVKIIGSKGLVKGGNSLKEVPSELQCFNENLESVSLMRNDIEKIEDMLSPKCPNVSVLLLQHNYRLKFIHKSFFGHMIGLNVLNLCRTEIEKLPDSVSDLANLKALLLSDCESLYYIPPIGKLTKLKELVVEGCYNLTELPEGIEELVRLEHLNVIGIGIQGTLSGSFISKLHSLESFSSNYKITVQPNELFSLRNVARKSEVLLSDANLVDRCVDLGGLNRLKTYSVCVGSHSKLMYGFLEDIQCVERKLYVGSCKLRVGKELRLHLPQNVQFLGFYACRFGGRSLVDDVPSLCDVSELEEFEIVSCEGMEYIISGYGGSKVLGGIQKLMLESLDDLICLIREEEVHPYVSFASLRRLEVKKCEKVKKLWLLNIGLPNLEEIEIQYCKQMEQVFATEKGATIELPRLRTVRLDDLPELRSICDNRVSCPELVSLQVVLCNKAKKLWLFNIDPNNLEEIEVQSCEQMEQVFATEKGATIELPRLCTVVLCDLPELRSICDNGVFCPGLVNLHVRRCNNVKKLGLLQSDNLNSLTTVKVSSCLLITEIFLVKDETRDGVVQLPCLVNVSLGNLSELRTIFGEGVVLPQLAALEVWNCPKVKRLALRSHNVPSLTDLFVKECQHIEEIFTTEEDADVTATAIQLPNLKKLRLLELPELRSICRKTLVCNSLELVEFDGSSNDKLENFPVSIPRLSTIDFNPTINFNRRLLPYLVAWNVSSALWLSLNWNDLDTKSILREHGCFISNRDHPFDLNMLFDTSPTNHIHFN